MGYQSKALDILHRLIPIIVVLEKKNFFVILSYIKSKIVGTQYLSRGTYTAAAMTSILPLFKEHQRDGEDVTRVRSLVTILLESFSKRCTRYCFKCCGNQTKTKNFQKIFLFHIKHYYINNVFTS